MEAEKSLALVVVGGMALSPALILLILPVLILLSSRCRPASTQAESRCYKMATRTGSLAMLRRPNREARPPVQSTSNVGFPVIIPTVGSNAVDARQAD